MSGMYSLALMAWSLSWICQRLSPDSSAPLGRLALVVAIAVRTASGLIPKPFIAGRLSSTRTAGRELPPTLTSPMPCTCSSFCASTVDAQSYIWPRVSAWEVSPRIMMGASAGFTLR